MTRWAIMPRRARPAVPLLRIRRRAARRGVVPRAPPQKRGNSSLPLAQWQGAANPDSGERFLLSRESAPRAFAAAIRNGHSLREVRMTMVERRGSVRGVAHAATSREREPVVSLRSPSNKEIQRPLARLRAKDVLEAAPWRILRNHRGQRHYSGMYWAETTGAFVVYESRLELARLMLADFDPKVTGIVAQPFLLRAPVSGASRRHVPDFLLVHADHTVGVVNVKPEKRLGDPKIADALAWPRQLIEDHGWTYEIWTGADPVYLGNVRFLAAVRRRELIEQEAVEAALGAYTPGDSIGTLLRKLHTHYPPETAKPAVLRLLWEQRLTTNLHKTLQPESILENR